MINKIKSGFNLFLLFFGISVCLLSFAHADTLLIAKLGKTNSSKIYTPNILKDKTDSWEDLSNEFIMFYSHGAYKQANIVAHQALSFAKNKFGEQHQNTADAYNKLGIAAEAIRNTDDAKMYYKEALALFELTLGKENAKVAMVLNNLGNLHFLRDEFKKAEELHMKSLLMRQQLFSSVHATVARSSYNLGKLYEKQLKNDDAIMFYKQAALIWKKTLGPYNANIANTFNNLANIFSTKGNNKAAEEYHLKALILRQDTLSADSLEIAESLFNLGTICTKQEKYNEAESYYQQALGIMEKTLDSYDPQIAMTLYSLANIYHIQAQKEYMYNQKLSDKIGSNSISTASKTTVGNKNNIMINQLHFRKKYVGEIFSKAEPLYQRAIDIVERKFGAKHPSVTVMKEELAMLHANMKTSSNK